jgi:aminoglycoside/choline kinase family phosphotransferase
MFQTMKFDKTTVRGRLDQYLGTSGLAARGARIVPLTGDASDRRYFRAIVPEAPDAPLTGPSMVLALHAEPFSFDTLPFVNVARLLERVPLPIPRILDHADELGILVLDDLGDVTLQAHLGAAPPAQHAALYRQAVAFIELLQRRGAELESGEYVPYRVAFDIEKHTGERDFFLKHLVEGYRGASIDAARRQAIREECAAIIDELAAEPRVLCHRDYHSRNLMLRGTELYIIDFQDARMGPDTYDLVSLCRDSYMDLKEETVDELIAYFLALRGRLRTDPAATREFRRRFDLMALQRNLKALGTFGYQTIARGNPVYIQYIPRTIRYVATNLAKYPRFGRLHELLAGHVEELR